MSHSMTTQSVVGFREKPSGLFYDAKTRDLGGYLGASPLKLESDPALISECAFDRQQRGAKRVCSGPNELGAMSRMLGETTLVIRTGDDDAVVDQPDTQLLLQRAKAATSCLTESCVVAHPRMRNELGGQTETEQALQRLFVPVGPFDSTRALADDEIYRVLHQWEKTYPEFHAIQFQMLDFAEQKQRRSALLQLDFVGAILDQGKRFFAVVFNSEKQSELGKIDPKSGKIDPTTCKINPGTGKIDPKSCKIDPKTMKRKSGKHWFAMFFDFRSLTDGDIERLRQIRRDGSEAGKKPVPSTIRFTRRCTIEYFNSSRRAVPYEQIHSFGRALESRLLHQLPGLNVWFVTATRLRQQHSKTECGMYSMVYIWRRLQGVPFTHFLLYRILDEDMHIARRHMFRSSKPI